MNIELDDGKILTGKPYIFDGKNPWVSGLDFPVKTPRRSRQGLRLGISVMAVSHGRFPWPFPFPPAHGARSSLPHWAPRETIGSTHGLDQRSLDWLPSGYLT